jgi:hypothetical protein
MNHAKSTPKVLLKRSRMKIAEKARNTINIWKAQPFQWQGIGEPRKFRYQISSDISIPMHRFSWQHFTLLLKNSQADCDEMPLRAD